MRIEAIDLLRGFAILGLPTMNMIAFSMPMSAYMNPTSFGQDDYLNHFLFSFFHLFSDQKFMGLFSLLFGASTLLLATKTSTDSKSPLFIHYSRMFWLFVIGLLHSVYLWEGDILALYALLGCLIYPLKDLSIKWLFFMASIAMGGAVLSSIVDVSTPLMGENEILAINVAYQPSTIDIQQAIGLYQGDYQQIQRMLLNHVIGEHQPNRLIDSYVLVGLLRAFSMMCLGMALFKLRLLQGAYSRDFYLRLCVTLFIIAMPVIGFGLFYNYSQQWSLASFARYGSMANVLGSVPMVVAYIALLNLFLMSDKAKLLKFSVQQVGKMALTNYLMQSLICALVFYGYGLGWYGELSRLQLLPIIFVLWIVQLILSTWWLKYFKQGPVEWGWRMLTYQRWQHPLR